MRSVFLVSLLMCVITSNLRAAPLAPPADLRGIYVDSNALPVSKTDSTALVASLKVPGVDGMVLVVGWSTLEPAKGKFQWGELDGWMNIAVAAGKKVELSIRTDYHTPAWLFQTAPGGSGASPLYFSFTRKPADTTCLTETIAAPWDTAFLAQWGLMLDSVSTHLKNTGMYDALVLLRLTGINKDSDELHLPAPVSSPPPCATDIMGTWQQAGYRPSLILRGWDGVASAFKKSFPDKTFSVAIIAVSNPFPAIAENGTVIKDSVPNQNFPLLTLAAGKFPGHLVIQNNTLYPGVPAEMETIQSAESLKTMIAFQTNEEIKGLGAACGGRGETTPCTDSTYLAELQTGIYPLGRSNPLRAEYIEVFALNVNASPAAILQAHNELFAGSSTAVEAPEPAAPLSFGLEQNYPNPFNPATTLTFSLAGRAQVRLEIFDVLGRLVRTLVNEALGAGRYSRVWAGENQAGAKVASGVYLVRLQAGARVLVRKMSLVQ